MPLFDAKLFADLSETSLKYHNNLTEGEEINHFRSLKQQHALQTFGNLSSPTREILAENLAVFRWKKVKPQSMAKAKHKFQKTHVTKS